MQLLNMGFGFRKHSDQICSCAQKLKGKVNLNIESDNCSENLKLVFTNYESNCSGVSSLVQWVILMLYDLADLMFINVNLKMKMQNCSCHRIHHRPLLQCSDSQTAALN